MNPRYSNRTYRTAAAAHAKVMAARQALTADLEPDAASEPMRRYPHSIGQKTAGSCPLPTPGDADGIQARILKQLTCQSQLLMDLLAAVNALTAATLAQKDKN